MYMHVNVYTYMYTYSYIYISIYSHPFSFYPSIHLSSLSSISVYIYCLCICHPYASFCHLCTSSIHLSMTLYLSMNHLLERRLQKVKEKGEGFRGMTSFTALTREAGAFRTPCASIASPGGPGERRTGAWRQPARAAWGKLENAQATGCGAVRRVSRL